MKKAKKKNSSSGLSMGEIITRMMMPPSGRGKLSLIIPGKDGEKSTCKKYDIKDFKFIEIPCPES